MSTCYIVIALELVAVVGTHIPIVGLIADRIVTKYLERLRIRACSTFAIISPDRKIQNGTKPQKPSVYYCVKKEVGEF